MFGWFKKSPEETVILPSSFSAKRAVTIIPENSSEFVSQDGTATIRQMKNGRFRLLVNGNEVLNTYTRRRDAVRGAKRRGLEVIG